eukprot:NODE_153_length_15389_cov_1.201439.p17 type:complete len:121 gc:universal NODE_153_length_15389_cov_1.201439:10513-10875(+)
MVLKLPVSSGYEALLLCSSGILSNALGSSKISRKDICNGIERVETNKNILDPSYSQHCQIYSSLEVPVIISSSSHSGAITWIFKEGETIAHNLECGMNSPSRSMRVLFVVGVSVYSVVLT